jgi:hypothetical protein
MTDGLERSMDVLYTSPLHFLRARQSVQGLFLRDIRLHVPAYRLQVRLQRWLRVHQLRRRHWHAVLDRSDRASSLARFQLGQERFRVLSLQDSPFKDLLLPDKVAFGTYDFVYLRIDFKSGCNVWPWTASSSTVGHPTPSRVLAVASGPASIPT